MRWFWIDHIIEHQPEQRMVAVKNVSRAEGYIHEHLVGSTPVMPFSLLIEGMAQTAGIGRGIYAFKSWHVRESSSIFPRCCSSDEFRESRGFQE